MTETRSPARDLELIEALALRHLSDQDARFREWRGYRPSEALPCPRVAAGKRCLVGGRSRETCICRKYTHALLDHERVWLDRDGKHVYTAEPYEFDGQEFAELVAECAGLGLEVTVTGASCWFPSQTVLIIIRKPEDTG